MTMRIFLIISLIFPALTIQAGIFQCKDKYGKLVYKDSECGSGDSVIKPGLRENASTAADDAVKNKIPNNTFIDDGKPGKLIFISKGELQAPYSIKVNEVRLITETEDTLVVDVIYTYKHKIPANEMRIYVTPNHGYWSVNNIQAEQGLNVGRARMGLSRSNMKKKWVTRSFTDTINIRFEHYPPNNTYKGVIWSETVKYEKRWKLK